MEDFGFKMQHITNTKIQPSKVVKVVLFIIAFILLILISIKIIQNLYGDINVSNVPLIKAQNKTIKELPRDSGGLVVDNLNINVYDVIDNNDDKNTNPIVNKTKQNIDIVNNLSNDILVDQEMLASKIDEIQNDNELNNVNELDNDTLKTEDIDNTTNTINNDNINNPVKVENVNKTVEKTESNIIINSKKNKIKTNVEDLSKLGNRALINNLKQHKDIKPGIKVQLLALKSKNGLIEYWNDVSNKYSQLFKDKNYYIENVSLDNIGNMYRLQVGMFDNEQSANNFCKEYIKLTNKNKIDCIIIRE